MPIEKLPNTPALQYDPMANALRKPGLEEIAAKLNEVIEAVNALDSRPPNANTPRREAVNETGTN